MGTTMRATAADYDAIVIGGGHNGLITAAYLAKAGLSTLVIEARPDVGGTAASETFAGATVNICNCDHVLFRSTPIAEELSLDDYGLEYDDMDPQQYHGSWTDDRVWSHHHDLEATLASIGRSFPDEVANYRRFVADALPSARMLLDAALTVPSVATLARTALARRLDGMGPLLRWSRRSAADVLRSYFRHPAFTGSTAVGGPMVWGVSPEHAGTGLGVLGPAIRHVAPVGRPRGGSGMLPTSIANAFVGAGGALRTSTRVEQIICEGRRVRGVRLDTGEEITAPIIISATDPRRTLLHWLTDPPPVAQPMLARWQQRSAQEGYESKIDAVVDEVPVVSSIGSATASTVVIAPTLAEIDDGFHRCQRGEVLPKPALLVNVPSVADPTLAPDGRHVLSVEVLYTPYGLVGGWPMSNEPHRWLELLASRCEPGLLDSIVEMRAMTPDRYEREFHLPAGHATSFAGGPLAVVRNDDPELTGYHTAIDGLYLTGAATFPGAGIWGASGRNCARVILDQHG